MKRKLTEAQEAEVMQRYAAGESGTALARQYEVCNAVIYRTVRKFSGHVRERPTQTTCPYSPARLQELYWKEKLTLQEIGTTAGADNKTVYRWLTNAGITLRPSGQARQLSVQLGKCAPSPPRWSLSPEVRQRTNENFKALRQYAAAHPEQVIEAARRGGAARALLQAEAARRRAPCGWCGDLIFRRASSFTGRRAACDRRCAAALARWQANPDAPRPLILARLRDILREHPYKALPFTRETLEKAGATLGAEEPEILEAMLLGRPE